MNLWGQVIPVCPSEMFITRLGSWVELTYYHIVFFVKGSSASEMKSEHNPHRCRMEVKATGNDMQMKPARRRRKVNAWRTIWRWHLRRLYGLIVRPKIYVSANEQPTSVNDQGNPFLYRRKVQRKPVLIKTRKPSERRKCQQKFITERLFFNRSLYAWANAQIACVNMW